VQPTQSLPVVHNDDITMMDVHGATFAPKIQNRTRTAIHSEDNYAMHVYFTGGKRVLVQVTE
jgi:hypothetical protein